MIKFVKDFWNQVTSLWWNFRIFFSFKIRSLVLFLLSSWIRSSRCNCWILLIGMLNLRLHWFDYWLLLRWSKWGKCEFIIWCIYTVSFPFRIRYMLICLVLRRTGNCLIIRYIHCWQNQISIIYCLFCSHLVIILEQLIIVWILYLIVGVPYSTFVSERIEGLWSWIWCWSEFVLPWHEFLEYLTHRRDIFHHIVWCHFKSFNFTWIKLCNSFVFVFESFKNSSLFIQYILCFIFHSCASHNLSVVTFSCLLTGTYLPKLIRFYGTLPIFFYSFNQFAVDVELV